eukprot:gene16338-7728_t
MAFGSILDLFDQTGHEPRVAIYCGHVPFHIDLKTGKWVSDQKVEAQCDTNKEDVKRYCQKAYPSLNITNIVEANKKVKIENWCKVGSKECNVVKKVVPYRCLVDEYEADALMVPKGCKFNHLHDEASCMTHDEWKVKAKAFCKKDDMHLNEYGILLSCGIDMFTGVEFVCCPVDKKKEEPKRFIKKKILPVDRIALEEAVKEVEKFLPEETKGCDRAMYETKRQQLEESHRSKIAAVVDEWDEAETRYKKMNAVSPKKAQEKMKKTLQVFRETLAALEEEAKEARDRLKTEHAKCIQVNINKSKRESMLAYFLAIQERPHSMKNIIRSARKFFQSCEHDRLHSLRHFQHLRKQKPKIVESLRKDLLVHLQQLNDLVNKSLGLLSFLPDVAEKFYIHEVFKLTPTQVPEKILSKAPTTVATEEPVTEGLLVDELEEKVPIDTLEEPFDGPFTEEQELTTKEPATEAPVEVTTVKPAEVAPITTIHHKFGEGLLRLIKKKGNFQIPHKKPLEHLMKIDEEEPRSAETEVDGPKEVEVNNESKDHFSKNTLNPTDQPPKTIDSSELEEPLSDQNKPTEPKPQKKHHHHAFFKHPRSPALFAAVIGLSCGALVIMLAIIVALVMRRNRANQGRLLVNDAGPEDQEHLVKMQKNGYENPTYKFFYY